MVRLMQDFKKRPAVPHIASPNDQPHVPAHEDTLPSDRPAFFYKERAQRTESALVQKVRMAVGIVAAGVSDVANAFAHEHPETLMGKGAQHVEKLAAAAVDALVEQPGE